MCPRFDFDPSKDSASRLVLPKERYEFVLGEPKPFARKNSKGDDSFGIRYPLTVESDGVNKGKRVFLETYHQSQGGRDMAKQFVIAVYGYGRTQQDEEKFNAEHKGDDWAYDTDAGTIGDAYRAMTGRRVIGDVDVQPAKDRDGNETGEQNQNYKGWYPLAAV